MFKENIDCIDAGTEYCPWVLKVRLFGRRLQSRNYFFYPQEW